jgi:hypothetical protein
MTAIRTIPSTSIHRRLCVRCGFDGRSVQEGVFRRSDPWCPNCGCDFRRRPPLSYAEMEGLYDEPFISVQPVAASPRRVKRARRMLRRRFERCLAAIFVLLVSFVVVGHFIYQGLSAIG